MCVKTNDSAEDKDKDHLLSNDNFLPAELTFLSYLIYVRLLQNVACRDGIGADFLN